MRKKVTLFFVLLSFISIANAKAKRKEPLNIFGVGVNFPFFLEYASEQRTSLAYTQPSGKYTYSGRINGIGVDLYGSHIASSGFGFTVDASIDFPINYSYREKSDGWNQTKKFKIANEWNPFFIIDLCVAPMYYFIRTDFFYLGLGPQFGLTFGYADPSSHNDSLMSIFGLGAGANLTLMYRFSPWVAISFGAKAMYWAQLADQIIITNANGTFEITPFVCASFILPKK